VDDIQLEGGPGKRTEVAALLVGPGAWTDRLRRPFGYAVDALGPDYMHCIPWGEVTQVGTSVGLARPAKELGLETADGRNVVWVGSPPRGTIRVSELLGSHLVTSSGTDLGRIWDIRVERQTDLPDERVNEAWRVTGLITGREGWKERIGVSPEGDPSPGEFFIPWQSVVEISSGTVAVAD
jgi:sporulation protein YlmC with PRC-barrel domain